MQAAERQRQVSMPTGPSAPAGAIIGPPVNAGTDGNKWNPYSNEGRISQAPFGNEPPWQDPLTPDMPENQALDLPLGLRRAAARTTDRLVLDRLMHDKNPLVIGLLLDNPRVVERDVVRIAAMRPTTIEIVTLIASHRRWGSQYSVRKAIVCNPFAPTDLKVLVDPTVHAPTVPPEEDL